MSTSIPPIRRIFSAGRKGLAPASAGNTTRFLRGDATWAEMGLNFLGEIAGDSVPATATDAGDFYVINAAGTSQSVTWAAGDWAIYNGTSGSWSKRASTVGPDASTSAKGFVELATAAEVAAGTDTSRAVVPADLHAYVNPALAARPHRDRYISPGAETNRRIEAAWGAHQTVAGTAGTLYVEQFTVPTSNPAAVISMANWAGVIANPHIGLWSLNLAINPSGAATVSVIGASTSDFRLLTYAGFLTAYAGKPVRLIVRFTEGNSTTNPVIYCNGVDITSSFMPTTGGTPPNWMDASLSTTYFLSAYNWPASDDAPVAVWCNYDIGATAAASLSSTGRWPAAALYGGSEIEPTRTSFVNSGFETFSGASTTGFTAVNSSGAGEARSPISNFTVVAGRKYRITFNFTLNSGPLPVVGLAQFGIQWLTGPAQTAASQTRCVAGANTVVLEITRGSGTSAAGFGIAFESLSGETVDFSVADIEIVPLGVLDWPQVQPILATEDGTRMGYSRLVVGFLPETTKTSWRITSRTATNGNQQLLGGAAFIDANRNRIDSWVINNLGTSKTVSLGNASAGTQYENAGTYAAGPVDVTLDTRIAATTSLWVNSNGTDTLVHTIEGHRIAS